LGKNTHIKIVIPEDKIVELEIELGVGVDDMAAEEIDVPDGTSTTGIFNPKNHTVDLSD
jgi:hypothetical protein